MYVWNIERRQLFNILPSDDIVRTAPKINSMKPDLQILYKTSLNKLFWMF